MVALQNTGQSTCFCWMSFVKKRENTEAKVRVEYFDQLKELFLLEFDNVVERDEAPIE